MFGPQIYDVCIVKKLKISIWFCKISPVTSKKLPNCYNRCSLINNIWAGISFDYLYSSHLLMCTCFCLAHSWKLDRVRPKSHIFNLKILFLSKQFENSWFHQSAFRKKLKVVIKKMVMEWKVKYVKIT